MDLFKSGAVLSLFAEVRHFRIGRQHSRQQRLRHPRRLLRGKADDRDTQFLRLVVLVSFRQFARQAEQFERGQAGLDGGQGDAPGLVVGQIGQQRRRIVIAVLAEPLMAFLQDVAVGK